MVTGATGDLGAYVVYHAVVVTREKVVPAQIRHLLMVEQTVRGTTQPHKTVITTHVQVSRSVFLNIATCPIFLHCQA